MDDLLTNYTPEQIFKGLLFCALLALAVKGCICFYDWAKDRLRRVFDKEYADKKIKSDINGLQEKDKRVDDCLAHLQEVDRQILDELAAIRKALDEHILVDDERNADSAREYILRFNMELVREIKHTREDFIEVLSKIDDYERYCDTHTSYRNNRAVSAIGNIKRVYADRLQKHDFL